MDKMTFENWQKTEYRPISGGDGELLDPNAPAPAVETPPDPDAPPPGTPPAAAPPKDDKIPDERWNEVYGELKQYRSLGKLDEVKANLGTFSDWKTRVEKAREDGKLTPEQKDDAQELENARGMLLKVMPELANLPQLAKDLAKVMTGHTDTNTEKASGRVTELFKGKSIEVSDDIREDVLDILWTKMSREQQEAVRDGDLSVLDEVFEKNYNKGMLSRLTPKNGNPPPNPPLRHGPGGTPPTPPGQRPKTFKEAEDIAWDRMKES